MSRAAFAVALLLSTLSIRAGAQSLPATCQSVREQDPSGALIQKTRLASKPFSFDPLLVWTSDDPDSVMIAVVGNSGTAKYASCHDLTLRADGQPVALGPVQRDTDPNETRTVVEYIRAEIPFAEALKLATAKEITYTVCKDQYRADSQFVCEAKDVIGMAGEWRREKAGKK
jgi:hypothetical protein